MPASPFLPVSRASDPLRRAACGAAALVFLTVFSACSGPQSLHQLKPETSLEWPLGAEGGRVVWVKTVSQFQDLGLSKGFWKRVQELVAGEDTRSIARPHGVLHDPAGRLYLADPGGGVVHSLDIRRGRYSLIGAGADSPLRTPIGLAVDERGRLYITDSSAGMVYRHDPVDGSLRPFLTEKLKRPTGIAFNPVNKLLYIVDTLESQIVAVDQDGVERLRLGAPGQGGVSFNRPTDLAIDRSGQIYVTDSLNFRITVFTPDGQELRQFGEAGDARGFFSRPKGVAADSDGHVYVCDSLRDAVQVFAADGSPLLVFGTAGSGLGQFWMPSGLYIDSGDYIFVADTYNQRIQVFRYIPGREARAGRKSKPPVAPGVPGFEPRFRNILEAA